MGELFSAPSVRYQSVDGKKARVVRFSSRKGPSSPSVARRVKQAVPGMVQSREVCPLAPGTYFPQNPTCISTTSVNWFHDVRVHLGACRVCIACVRDVWMIL